MRILIHDYAGHPFQIELSRSLAKRGHQVLHVYSASNPTPQGALARRPDDSPNFQITGITLTEQIDKNSLVKRRAQEIAHGKGVLEQIEQFKPNVVISANTPLDAQTLIQKKCRASGVKFVFWLQDLLGIGSYRILSKKLPIAGHMIGSYYVKLERTLLKDSNAIVLITDDFRDLMDKWGIPAKKVYTIENWAPLDEVPQQPKSNSWAQEHGVAENFCFLYSGTLGMKHNPDMLLQLALHQRDNPNVKVIVITEGLGANWLTQQKQEKKLENLTILPFQPFSAIPEVLGSADVLMALLEPSAGIFSVPSKILTYLCAGRPVLLAVPLENLSAKIVTQNKAGFVAAPTDIAAFVEAAERLRQDEPLRASYGRNARRYAETHFDISAITDKFEALIAAC